MNKAREKLELYRKQRVSEEHNAVPDDTGRTAEVIADSGQLLSPSPLATCNSSGSWSRFDIDLLDSLPFRLFRRCYERDPRTTLLLSLLTYILGQITFIWIEFGAVFFIFSLLFAMCLTLGRRNENEASAYSVFNPNCERLLGQMTSEHFERDVLRRRVQ